MEAKHTPGSWRAVPPAGRQTQWTIFEGEGFHAKWVCKMYLGEAPDLEEPYAHLIAAAPDLLQALRDCYAMAIVFAAMYAEQRGLKSGERVWQHAEALSKARAALDKAEGR